MREHVTWSVSLGRCAGIRVHVHVFFFLFVAFTLFLGWQANRESGDTNYIWIAAVSLSILAASVLLHALAHCHMALRLGANVDQILLGPLGEMAPVQHVHIAARDLAIAVTGPLANAFICLCCLFPLVCVLGADRTELVGLLWPLQPTGVDQGMILTQSLKLVFWINWLLFLINVIPVFPLDGGRALRALLLIVVPGMEPSAATMRVARIAQMVAFSLIVAAYVFRDSDPMQPVPAWFALVILGIFLFFAAQHEIDRFEDDDAEEDFFGYDFSQGYTSLNCSDDSKTPSRSGLIARWLAKRQTLREQRKSQREADEERRMDEILTRLHERGIKGLSTEDRRLLARVSQRYRSRMD